MNQLAHYTEAATTGGYFTVNVPAAGQTLPYIVFAKSDFDAARIVKRETGYMAVQHDVEGPFHSF